MGDLWVWWLFMQPPPLPPEPDFTETCGPQEILWPAIANMHLCASRAS